MQSNQEEQKVNFSQNEINMPRVNESLQNSAPHIAELNSLDDPDKLRYKRNSKLLQK